MIRDQLLREAAGSREAFQAAKPFRHIAIDDFLEAPIREAMLGEITCSRSLCRVMRLHRMRHRLHGALRRLRPGARAS